MDAALSLRRLDSAVKGIAFSREFASIIMTAWRPRAQFTRTHPWHDRRSGTTDRLGDPGRGLRRVAVGLRLVGRMRRDSSAPPAETFAPEWNLRTGSPHASTTWSARTGSWNAQSETSDAVETAIAPNQLRGRVKIAAPLAGLSARLAKALAQPTLFGLGDVRILNVDDECVEFEQLDVPRVAARIAEGRTWFASQAGAPNQSVATYQLRFQARRGLVLGAQICLAIGLVSIVAMAVIMERWVISSNDPAVRWQSLQSLQIIHVLWPPFLFTGLVRVGRTTCRMRFNTLLSNLPHQD